MKWRRTGITNAEHGRNNFKNIGKNIKISEGEDGEILATKLDFDYAYRQTKLDEKTRKVCIFTLRGGEFTGHYRFLKEIYGLADISTTFQERIGKTQTYIMAWWHKNSNKKRYEETRRESSRNFEKIRTCRIQTKSKEVQIFQEGNWIGRSINRPARKTTTTRPNRSKNKN